MRIHVTLLLVLIVISAPSLGAQPARAAARAARRAVAADLRAIFKRDLARDAATASRRLLAPRRVFRYTTKSRALREAKHGLPAGTHMTGTAGPGRPMSGATAARKYGLPRIPTVRELIELPRGAMVRVNKALNGWRGAGETTSRQVVKPGAIKRIVPLRK
ncbi:MAG: hypothetical protein ABS52_07735 [Gemmatimonadetes bacterium SCN 70-22]|nr:MAG: hypothetical protein ABS52_07735 [Gemmatimonadetes bacterium SCN 70-22]